MTPAKRSLRDYIVVEGSFALMAAIPVAAVFAHRAFAPIAFLMAAVAGTRLSHWNRLRSFASLPLVLSPKTALAFALAALPVWIAITGLWSPTAGAVWHGISIAAAVLAAFLIVLEVLSRDMRDARRLAPAFVGASLIALALLFFEAHTNGYLRLVTPPADLSPQRFKDITALGRGVAALTPSLFPAAVLALMLAPPRTPRLALIVAAAALFTVALSAAFELTIAANSAAVLAGTLFALIALKRPCATVAALTFVFFLTLALAPAIAFLPVDAIAERFASVLPLSWLQRLYVWRHLAGEALACLPLGCGADFARSLSDMREVFIVPGAPEPLRLVPLHPHNAFLQVWLEFGLPGVALAGAALLAGGRLARNLAPPVAAALAGAAAATLVYWSVEASLWQEWRLASLVVAGAGIAIIAIVSRARA